MEALKQPTIRVIAIIAEGVPEADAKRLIAYARANNKVHWTSLLQPRIFSGLEYTGIHCIIIDRTKTHPNTGVKVE
jgi:hypothetical protein